MSGFVFCHAITMLFGPIRSDTSSRPRVAVYVNRRGVPPGYEEKAFDAASKRGRLRLVASPDGREGSVTIHQDASLYAGLFDGDESADFALAPGRRAYVHLIRGELEVNGEKIAAGDALKITRESRVRLAKGIGAEALLFDLP